MSQDISKVTATALVSFPRGRGKAWMGAPRAPWFVPTRRL